MKEVNKEVEREEGGETVKSFLIHRISKPNFLRRFDVPCGRSGEKEKKEKEKKLEEANFLNISPISTKLFLSR